MQVLYVQLTTMQFCMKAKCDGAKNYGFDLFNLEFLEILERGCYFLYRGSMQSINGFLLI